MRFKQFLETDWDDFFKSDSKIIQRDPPQVQDIVLPLYRGFNLNTVQQENNIYILNPERSEQGMLWFTHPYIVGYNPVEYAASHGDWFLTYQLPCKKHTEKIHWSDGKTYDDIPDAIHQQTNNLENCKFHMGIELPEGWLFSYKHEKFIGCTKSLQVTRDMIQPSESALDDH